MLAAGVPLASAASYFGISQAQALRHATGPDESIYDEYDAHDNPPAGKVKIYAKTDSKMYSKDDAGVETELGGGANHNILDGSVHPDTVTQGVTKGSIIYGNATPKWDELVKGSDRQILQQASDIPSWAHNLGHVLQDKLVWKDEFLGNALNALWTVTAGGTGSASVIDGVTGAVLKLDCPANNDEVRVNWNNIRTLIGSKEVIMQARILLSDTNNETFIMFLRDDANNELGFYYNPGGSPGNYDVYTWDGGGGNFDSGIACDTNFHIFRVELHTAGGLHAHYYIDGIETDNSPQNSNIPTVHLQPNFYFKSQEAVPKYMYAEYVEVIQNR